MNPPPNFNRLARLYRWMEFATFGPFLVQTRNTFLPETATAANALILGDGDGRFTARLLRANPKIQIDAVDSSSAMLQSLLRRAGPHAHRVRTHLTDARDFQPPNPPPEASYDLIVTHFFLDCLTTAEIQSLATALRAAASPNAQWLVSEFAIPHTHFGRLIAAPIVYTLYQAFGFLTGLAVRTLPDHRAALRQSGFVLLAHRTHLAGLLVSELWSANPSPTRRVLPK
ncbi:MAG: class I SAM-dependent methyltransferase [Terracidiphilus sp.]